MPKKRSSNPRIDDPESNRVVSLRTAAQVLGISVDTLRKHYPELIVRVGPKRVGMWMSDVLAIPKAA